MLGCLIPREGFTEEKPTQGPWEQLWKGRAKRGAPVFKALLELHDVHHPVPVVVRVLEEDLVAEVLVVRGRPAGGRATCRLLDAALPQGGGSARSARLRPRLDASRHGSKPPEARGPEPVALRRRQWSLGRPASWEAVAQAPRWSRPSRKLEAEASNAMAGTVPAYCRPGS
ncbi:hypothetical protein J1605_007980 [Eschrichtius robustus]|uniref:Uncharacterized protein n=1 Tax=Eschrichtius robustus TaxID=9764 RepID=A0AB34GYT7_ESCRO|nr:hypothetical protein J1605_007980 [Eschrichtius robustus]